MSETRHERPGVYSVYDASSVTSAGRAAKRHRRGGPGREGNGQDSGDTDRLQRRCGGLWRGRRRHAGDEHTFEAAVCQRRVHGLRGAGRRRPAGLEAYQAAFAALADCDVQVVVCDSSELTIQKALKTAVETASAARRERIGVIGGSGDTAAQLVTRAAAINSERMVLVGPDMKDESGTALPGVFAAAAVAGAIAAADGPGSCP